MKKCVRPACACDGSCLEEASRPLQKLAEEVYLLTRRMDKFGNRLDAITKSALQNQQAKTSVIHKGEYNPDWFKVKEPSEPCEG